MLKDASIDPKNREFGSSWSRSLADAVRDVNQLIELLNLPKSLFPQARAAVELFPLMVPKSYLNRIEPGNPNDPLLLQVLPLGAEFDQVPGFSEDAVGDSQSKTVPGLLQKYAGRALFIATGSCAVHCRYCFRRHYPYGDEPKTLAEWEPAFDALEADTSIKEIILSGGDPLMLTDARLAKLFKRFDSIEHLSRLRIHSRLPIVLPNRMTDQLIQLLRNSRLTPIMVVHANHPQELQGDCSRALQKIVQSGITVLNQAVLLKGINDSVKPLEKLCERLVDLGVMPYYLHQLDRVAGAAHFEVSEQTGRQLIEALRKKLPGYAVPRYVREIPGGFYKKPLFE